METLKYKDYEGTCEISVADNICHGRILFVDDLVTYESATPNGLQEQFEAAVDDYLKTCLSLGIPPKKPLKGQFNVRISPELHKKAMLKSYHDDTSLNEVVKKALESFLQANGEFG